MVSPRNGEVGKALKGERQVDCYCRRKCRNIKSERSVIDDL